MQRDGQSSLVNGGGKIRAWCWTAIPQQFEVRLKRTDATMFDAEVELNSFVADGERHIVGMVRDITKRKAALSALKDSEQRFRASSPQRAGYHLYTGPQGHVHLYQPGLAAHSRPRAPGSAGARVH
jgi:hypothetical protein